MDVQQPIPGDFISLSSSEDEAPPPKRKKRALEDSTGISARSTADNASMNRSKRARVSASSDSISGAKGSEEGEIDENGVSVGGDEGQTGQKPDDGMPGVFVPPNPPVYVKDSLSLQLPVFSQKREGSWFARFKDWTQVLFTSNAQHAAAFTPALVQAAYKQYIDNHSGLKAGKKRGAKQASAQFEEAGSLANLLNGLQPPSGVSQPSGGAPAEPESQPTDAPQTSKSRQVSASGRKPDLPAGQPGQPIATLGGASAGNDQPDENTRVSRPDQPLNGAAMALKEGIPTGADALDQQRRYFPSASDPANMCLLCGREGHTAADCAHSSCRFCGQDGHWDFICSTIQARCSKCNQLGHTSGVCVEKLALTKDEGLACSSCSSPNHLEDECTEPWRSFRPDAQTIKTVAFLPASCSICGHEKHFSSECRQRSSPNPTWSLTNRSRYLDPVCGSNAIEETFAHAAEQEAAPNRQPDLKIRGHASRATHIHYSETDDSEVEFLGQRPANNKPARIGQIRVSSNIQMPNARQQPPLPPGPPPAFARYPPPPGMSGYGSSQHSAPPPSLPAKPPAPTRNYNSVPPPPPTAHNSQNQSSRGRGGRGRGGGEGGGGGGGGRGSFRGGRFRGRKRGG